MYVLYLTVCFSKHWNSNTSVVTYFYFQNIWTVRTIKWNLADAGASESQFAIPHACCIGRYFKKLQMQSSFGNGYSRISQENRKCCTFQLSRKFTDCKQLLAYTIIQPISLKTINSGAEFYNENETPITLYWLQWYPNKQNVLQVGYNSQYLNMLYYSETTRLLIKQDRNFLHELSQILSSFLPR